MAQFAPDLEQLRSLQDKVVVLTGCLPSVFCIKLKANSEKAVQMGSALLPLMPFTSAELL